MQQQNLSCLNMHTDDYVTELCCPKGDLIRKFLYDVEWYQDPNVPVTICKYTTGSSGVSQGCLPSVLLFTLCTWSPMADAVDDAAIARN